MKLLKRYFSLLLALVMLLGVSLIAEAAETMPFKEHILPGSINFVDFDLGGPGVSHSRMAGKPEAYIQHYRDDADLNFYQNPVWHIGSMVPMWYVYTVKVSKAGSYDVYAAAAAQWSPTFTFYVDGEFQCSGTVSPTGNWTNFRSEKIGTIEFADAGTHVIRVEHSGVSANISVMKFVYMGQASKIDLSPTTGAYRKHYLPTTMQAEDYDVDGYYSTDNQNAGDEYRKKEPMDVLADNFTEVYDGVAEKVKRIYLSLIKNEFVTYTFQVDHAGAYMLQACALQNSGVTFFLDDIKLAEADLPGCNSRDYQDVANVWLPEGEHKLRVLCSGQKAMIDYLNFVETDKDSYLLSDLADEEEPVETEVLYTVYKDIYVAPDGSDANDGTKSSPFATWKRANEEVQKYNADMTGHIVVHFAGGNYPVPEMMTMDEKISGHNGYKVIYKGDDLLNPPVFNGGTKVEGWQPQEGSPIWVADASNIEDTRNLYINEFPAVQARSRYRYQPDGMFSNEGSQYSSDGFQMSVTNFPKHFSSPEDMMIVWPLLWTTTRTPVDNVYRDEKFVYFQMKQPEWATHTTQGASHLLIDTSDSFVLENAIELLDEPGEFYFDKKTRKMYYYPYNEEDLTTADVWAATTENMLYMSGSTMNNKIKGVEFNNLSFKYSAWNAVSETGVKVNQTDEIYLPNNINATYYLEDTMPAQITIHFVEDIAIKNCEFACLGSNAINMDNGVLHAEVCGNIFRDVAGTGLMVGSHKHKVVMPDGQQRCEYITVENNVLHRVAYEHCGCAAIAVYYPAHTTVQHNDVRDLPYTGISVGWGWGVWDPPEVRDIHVLYNHVENVINTNMDGAHIYTLGKMEESTIKYNYLVKSGDSRGGIYLDQNSCDLLIEGNVVQQVNNPLFIREGANLRRNIVQNNYIDTAYSGFGASESTEINTVSVLDGKWPEEAQRVMNEAGVEPQYSHLLKKAAYPKWRVFAWDRYGKAQFAADMPDVNRWVIGQEYDDFFEITNEKPSIYPGGHLGDTHPGEWVSFNVLVEDEGNYKLSIRASDGWSSGPDCKAKLTLDDEVIVDGFLIPRDTWALQDIEVGNVYLTAGTHVFKMEVQGNDWMIGGFIFDNGKVLKDDPNYDEGTIIDEATLLDRYSEGFKDTPGHWAYYNILAMTKAGYIKGYDKHTFGPDDPVTLHQACMLALRVLGNQSDEGWQEKAADLDMLASVSEGDMAVSRERFIDIAMKAYSSKKGKYTIVVGDEYYSDAASISDAYRYPLFGARDLKLVEGYEDGTIRPHNTLTRAEAVTILLRLVNIIR